jgi:uncharacterized protein YdaU (DUF1376 family)
MYYYKKNIGDYYKKTGRLSMLEHGAYTLLIDACYDRERFPTLEEALDWTWARTDAEIEAVKFVLSKFFELNDGIYTQSRIADELMNYHALSEINSRIAKEREEKRRNRKRTEHEACTTGSRSDHEAPPNQEPRTKNQEPLTSINNVGESDKPTRFMFNKELLNLGCDKDLVVEYMEHRKKKGGSNGKIAFDGLIREQQKSGLDLGSVLRICIERGWRGFEASWLNNQNSGYQQKQDNRPPDIGEYMRNQGADFLDVTPQQNYLENK